MTQKTALVRRGGGFIGDHLVKRLKREGYRVAGCDLKAPEYGETHADDFARINKAATKASTKKHIPIMLPSRHFAPPSFG